MDVLESLNNYCQTSERKAEQILDEESKANENVSSEKTVYDVTTPAGYFLNALQEKGFNMADLQKVLEAQGSNLIVSIAGSGKTTSLIFKIIYDIITGEATTLMQYKGMQPIRVVDKIWVCTFLKSGALELKDRMRYWQNSLGYTDSSNSIHFSTLHAEFKRAIEAMIGKRCNIETDESVFNRIVKKCCNELCITRNGNALNTEDIYNIRTIITYARNRLDNTRYEHENCIDYNITAPVLNALIDSFNRKKSIMEIMDFEDLQDLLYKYLYIEKNPAVIEFIQNRYNYIYIDEFQDTSQIQYEILKVYASKAKKIIAIGDDDQAIYSFRGGDVNIIVNRFKEDFRPNITTLTYNYRCPSNILNPISKSIQMNTNRCEKEIKSAVEGGVFKAYTFNGVFPMISKLQADIKDDMQNNKTVAILCRTNFDGMIPAIALEMQGGFDFSISSLNMTMGTGLPRQIINIAKIFTEINTQAVKNTLGMLVPYREQWKLKDLQMTMRMDNCSIFQIPLEDIQYSLPDLYDVLSTLFEYRKRKEDIEGLKYLYTYIKEETYKSDTPYCVSARAFIDTLLFMLETGKYNTVNDFLFNVKTINERLCAKTKDKVKKARINIVTVHEFKGKERDCTYIWNDCDDVFPSSKCNKNNEDSYEEERRIHYIACTRAREKNVIYTRTGKVSPFVVEMGVACETYTDPIKGVLTKDKVIKDKQSFEETLEGIKQNTFNIINGNTNVD